MPAIFFQPNSRRLRICTAIGYNKNYCIDGSYNLPYNVFTNINIQQRFSKANSSYQFTIKINGTTKAEVTNDNPVTIDHASVYLSNPWYTVARIQVKNLVVKSEHAS